ncbi:unnamed protein product [Rotaria sp. Silwood2]|nr:unnamed protein product [Rotaria sp. Silwood2]
MQTFYSTWTPNTDQSTTVINTDKIVRKLEAAYGIESGSIYINTIMITNGKSNVDDDRRRPQSDRKEREKCDQLGSVGSIVEITMHIIYPAKCGISMACKKEFANIIQARIETYVSSISLKFEFDDESFSEIALTRCKTTTDSSLNTLSRSRRGKATTKTSTTTQRTTTPGKQP